MIELNRKKWYDIKGKLSRMFLLYKIKFKIAIEKRIYLRAYFYRLFFSDKER